LNLGDLDSLVQKLNAIREKLKERQKEQEKAKELGYQKSRETERLKKLSLVAEKSFDLKAASEETLAEEVEAEISKLKTEEMELEKQIAKSVSDVKFPIKNPNPEISEGNATFYFEEGAYENAIDYLKLALSINQQLIIDNAVFYADKIVIRGKSNADEATDCLMNAAKSIWALGSIMLGKVSEEMKKTIDFLNRSKYKQLWEFLGPRGTIPLQNAYENFGLTDETEKKNARTFYSQLESRVTPPLTTGDGKGNFQLTIYGRLVWASYKKICCIPEEKAEEGEHVSEVQEAEKVKPTETTRKPSQTALQNFMEKVLLNEGEGNA
jgi:tetratricopeptide (TPR) repeat protein